MSKPSINDRPPFLVEGRQLRFRTLTFTLDVEEISAIHPHEEILPSLVDRLAYKMRRDGVQIAPVIIDATTKVALDGMHRIEALKRIGSKMVLVCAVDYWNELIKVARWFRCLREVSGELLEDLTRILHLQTVEDTSKAVKEVNGFRSPLALLTKKDAYLSRLGFTSTFNAYDLVRRFDHHLYRRECSFKVEPDSKALEDLITNYAAVLYVSPIGKRDVLESGQSGKLLPPKSSRHITPCRPVKLSYPVQRLNDTRSIESSRRYLDMLLKKLKYNFKPSQDSPR